VIFVTVGSSTIAFDRLLEAIDSARIDEPLVVQHGPSSIRPRNADCVDFLDFDEFLELIRDARIVVTHAGVGSIMATLAERHHPIVMPRRGDEGEAVDDHQVSFARRVGELGLVTLVENAASLADALESPSAGSLAPTSGRSQIEIDLRNYIRERVGPPPPVLANEGSAAWS
jgi:beta-1,4-N-acetylglucosaminyltransferase